MQTIERDKPSLLIETLDKDMRAEITRMLPQRHVVIVAAVGETTPWTVWSVQVEVALEATQERFEDDGRRTATM